jgi:hypothetical protein
MKAPNEKRCGVLRIRNCTTPAQFKYNILQCHGSTMPRREMPAALLQSWDSQRKTGDLHLIEILIDRP